MMTEKRFFILRDDVYNTSPCIRDRTFELKDIYGDFKYDDINEICDFMNKLVDENEQLKQENKKLADALTVYFQSKTKGGME